MSLESEAKILTQTVVRGSDFDNENDIDNISKLICKAVREYFEKRNKLRAIKDTITFEELEHLKVRREKGGGVQDDCG